MIGNSSSPKMALQVDGAVLVEKLLLADEQVSTKHQNV